MAHRKRTQGSGVDLTITSAQAVRLWTKVEVRSQAECWPWLGYLTRKGYGVYNIGTPGEGYVMAPAYRVAYRVAVGPIPDGFHMDHLCCNPSCMNPSHLEAVPQSVNTLRGTSFAAVNAAKTHCPEGHPYDMVRPGRRQCRQCRQRSAQEAYLRRKAAT